MKNSSEFFCNSECEYFPCHKVERSDSFNCLFCYCPLYKLSDCGGNFTILKGGLKDCTNCTLPHRAENYKYIMKKLEESNR